MSLSTAEVSPDEHVAWLRKILDDPARKLYVAECDGIAVGTMRADVSDGVTELSWTIAPEARGRGHCKAMVYQLCSGIRGAVRAEIKVTNLASQRIAEYAGLRFVSKRGDLMVYARNI